MRKKYERRSRLRRPSRQAEKINHVISQIVVVLFAIFLFLVVMAWVGTLIPSPMYLAVIGNEPERPVWHLVASKQELQGFGVEPAFTAQFTYWSDPYAFKRLGAIGKLWLDTREMDVCLVVFGQPVSSVCPQWLWDR
ncbi:hypothetical protein COU89_00765 [Candidatus Roizmanbacteria bacterium CG10_big_fil_rev_8_21_14_0_10_45_7]|uniref:Uncharacterized protein n=1 Tax=Candidatus Roizmanbacteria bacterium CG10_big_fil_rev_8_21_14_0_10_45_7 TaxID=1974854 RepID=A0A2M8KVE8_9BACT|nr:MAG: hypothetical protein COU89_00765 [Candidatus Roizmanbacteria bacterium CG10_big_fil_rev_8_21_14_0_10_45_7]